MRVIDIAECAMEQVCQWEVHHSRESVSLKCLTDIGEGSLDVRTADKVYRCAGLAETEELIKYGIVSQTDGEHGFAPNREYCDDPRYLKLDYAIIEYKVGPSKGRRNSLAQEMHTAGWTPNNESGCMVWGIGTQTKMVKPTGWGRTYTWGNAVKDPYMFFWSSLRSWRLANIRIAPAAFRELMGRWTRRRVWFELLPNAGESRNDLLNVNPVCHSDVTPIGKPYPGYKLRAYQRAYIRYQSDRSWARRFDHQRTGNPNTPLADRW